MKKLIAALFYLFVMYMILKAIILFFRGGHNIDYSIEKDDVVFLINEEYVSDGKESHYFLTIEVEDNVFYFQTFSNLYRFEEIVKDVGYVKTDNAICLLPTFALDKILMDATCYYDNNIYNYANIKDLDEELDSAMENIHKKYDVEHFLDDSDNILIDRYVSVYVDNVIKGHYVFVDNYNGVDLINDTFLKKIAAYKIFRNDHYSREIQTLVGHHLITADYNQENEFDRMKVVDIQNGIITEVQLPSPASYNSYFLGNLEGLAYLFDPDSKIQYQINLDTKNTIELGNETVGIRIFDGDEWSWVPVEEVIANKTKFEEKHTLKTETFEMIQSVLGEKGFIYYAVATGDNYRIYKAPTRNPEYMKFLFETSQIDQMIFKDDYIYFKDDLRLKYFHQTTGLKTLIINQEFIHNESLDFGVYIK